MGLFNWFSWRLERHKMQRRIVSLVGDLTQATKEVTKLRIASDEAQLLLHDAERGAKLAAEEQDKLKIELDLHKSAVVYWESVAKKQRKRIAELCQPTIELSSVTQSTEPAETELERKAWELYSRLDLDESAAFDQAQVFLAERDRRRALGGHDAS